MHMYETRQNKKKVSRRINGTSSGMKTQRKNSNIMLNPSKGKIQYKHQLSSSEIIFQLKPLNVYEKRQLDNIKQSSLIFDDYEFILFIVKYINNVNRDEYNIKNAVDKIEKFLNILIRMCKEANISSKKFHNFKTKYDFYINSGYRNHLLNIKYKIKSKDKSVFLNKRLRERENLAEVTVSDELYFQEYIKKQKKPKIVYRGDGRNLDIKKFQIATIKAEGNTDISFYGTVEHTFSNSAKNGMISTTTDKEQAKDWGTVNCSKTGVVYTIYFDNYVDVDALLSNRNFKNRYQGQKEILSLGDINVSQILFAEIINKSKQIIDIKLPPTQYSSPFSIANNPIIIKKRIRPIM